MAIFVVFAFLVGGGGVAAQGTSSYSVNINVYGRFCANEAMVFETSIVPTPTDERASWIVTLPSGGQIMGSDLRIEIMLREVGGYSAALTLYDRNGNKVGGNSTNIVVAQCAPDASPQPSSSPMMHQDCYDERYGFYDCNNPPSDACVVYQDGSGAASETCPSAPPPTMTPSPYNADACRTLLDERDAFASQWKYDYYAYYEKMAAQPGSDARFEEDMAVREADFDSAWRPKWQQNGCDTPYTYGSSDCSTYWGSAQDDLTSLRERYAQYWEGYYAELERVRASWASYSEEERQIYEARWSENATDLSARYDAELGAIGDRYKLWECGFQSDPAVGPRPVYRISSRPLEVNDYTTLRSECESRIGAIKEIYIGEFETLRAKLDATTMGTSEYDAARSRLSDLEQKVATEVEAVLRDCREEYRQEYAAPSNFRDGMGSLACSYDDSISKIKCQGAYVSFVGDPQSQFVARFSCGGQPVFDDIYANRVFERFEFVEDQDSASLMIRSENLKLIFHDGPRGVINAGAVGDVELYFVPSPHLAVAKTEQGLQLSSTDGWTSLFTGQASAAPSVFYDEIQNVITVSGEATWLAQTCRPDGSNPEGEQGIDYYDAIKQGRLGAEITISSDRESEENYGGMDLAIERQGGNKFIAVIDSEQETCKTVVLKFDSGIFDTIKLNIVMTDASGAAIAVTEAANLEDVLDPCDDGEDGFEYWIVQDRLGTQVLVSFAHFSEKRVSVEAASVGNVIVPGFGGAPAVAAIALVAVALLVVRRRVTP
jgi:hypothetical protein